MKTRKAEKAKAEEEKPSSDEEDAISVESVKIYWQEKRGKNRAKEKY